MTINKKFLTFFLTFILFSSLFLFGCGQYSNNGTNYDYNTVDQEIDADTEGDPEVLGESDIFGTDGEGGEDNGEGDEDGDGGGDVGGDRD